MRGADLDFGRLGNALFQDTVNKEVLQAIMRFGRTESGGEQGAVVYVHTSRLPRWIEPSEDVTVQTWSDGMKEVIEVLCSSEEWSEGELTNREIAEDTSIGLRQVGELMKELAEEDYVTYRRGGRGNAYHWSNLCIERVTEYGELAEG